MNDQGDTICIKCRHVNIFYEDIRCDHPANRKRDYTAGGHDYKKTCEQLNPNGECPLFGFAPRKSFFSRVFK